MEKVARLRWPRLGMLAPGILVAATGVGAGDLLTASLGGSAVGLAILWAACAGAVLKWFLNEGIARWQMATGTTLLEGWVTHLGRWLQWVFILYLVAWTVLTGGALANACGVAGAGLFPIFEDLRTSKIAWGMVQSIGGMVLVLLGGFRLFEKLMCVFIGVMFVAVLATAVLIGPNWSHVGRCMIWPTIPRGEGLGWMLGVLGGVGGTLTLLSYGYWIREKGRTGMAGLRSCRLDLGVGYMMTAAFGLAMIIIGSRVRLEKGDAVALDLAEQLGAIMGPARRWVFLVGFWGAVFSSLLGVWQSMPYLFADFMTLRSNPSTRPRDIDYTKTRAYRGYLLAIALVPLPSLWFSIKQVQLSYAILGSLCIPLLALTLLIMNNRTAWVGKQFRNRRLTNVVLGVALIFFVGVGLNKVVDVLYHLIGGK